MAFKMNYNKDTFPYKDMGPTKYDDTYMTKTIAKDKKPDFLDHKALYLLCLL